MQLSGRSLNAQRGVGLIEVLIAVLVLAFGMLGMVGLQTWALRNNQSALERGMATVQANSIIDAMRANRQIAITNGFDIGVADLDPTGTTFRDVAIATWRTSLRQALNATATGGIDCGAGGAAASNCTITVQWSDARAGSASQTDADVLTQVTQVLL
jgi:type IV pilus assembly protein PilV